MKLGKADAMTLPQKIDYFCSEPGVQANFGWNINLFRQFVKALFVTNNGNYLYVKYI